MSDTSEYACQSCGACCLGLDVVLSDVEAETFEADPRLAALTVLHHRSTAPPLRLMRKHADTGRCAALFGPLTNCRCDIYGQRPSLCREFAAGSPDCREARARCGR